MLKIVKYPSPILEQIAQDVTFPLSKEDKQLIADMIATMEKVDGAGLAANQVNVSKKICIVKMIQKHRKIKTDHLVLINPKIIMESEVRCLYPEGCLSFPGEFYYVDRPCNVIVRFQDEMGKYKELQVNKFLSSQIQHETDHLYGILYTSKAVSKIPDDKLENISSE